MDWYIQLVLVHAPESVKDAAPGRGRRHAEACCSSGAGAAAGSVAVVLAGGGGEAADIGQTSPSLLSMSSPATGTDRARHTLQCDRLLSSPQRRSSTDRAGYTVPR